MKSWTCIENCGACCKFDLNERSDLANKLNKEDIALINSMTAKDGWCKNLDRANTSAEEDPKKTANGLLEVPLIVKVANCVLSPNSAMKTVRNVDNNKLKTIYK